jgi:TRAP transporter TAXI family solute receptor
MPFFALLGSLLVVALGGCQGGSGNGKVFLSIGTGGTGGIYYPLGGAIASLLSAGDSLRQYTAEVTGGSVENVNRLREGQIDLGFALSVSVYEAFHGGSDYVADFEDLTIVAPLYANLVHVLVPRGSSVRSLTDLAGKKVSVGAAGSGTEQVARQLLEVYGLDYTSVEARYLTFSESAGSLRDGAIDAAILSVGYPAAAVLEATTTGGARLLSLDPDRVESLIGSHPYYAEGLIPSGAYPGVEADISTVAMMNWIVARRDLDGEVVRRVLDLFRNRGEALRQVHEMAGQVDLDALDEAPIPLHPAVTAWRE